MINEVEKMDIKLVIVKKKETLHLAPGSKCKSSDIAYA